ncbi:MAG: transcriptional regulator [Pseudonocardiaceae bacterium]|nr:transcriptional regulator [Pseudonocardiaceae bacterium]
MDSVLAKLQSGAAVSAAERQRVDCKEEAGQRGRDGLLLPGQAHNTAAATQLADEVACLANTPGGGALVVGIEDRTGEVLGTSLDMEWLRHRVYQAVDVAPVVEERFIGGVRLLVLLVAVSREPVEDTSGRLRWRVGSHCTPVDRSEWWLHRQGQAGYDSMAASTGLTVEDTAPGALSAARRYLSASDSEGEAGADGPLDLLRRLGAILPDERLTQAGALVFCPADRNHLSMSVLDVEGGDVVSQPPDMSGLSLLEQLVAVEQRLDAVNGTITIRDSFAETAIRRLPPAALREAVVNGLVHRDWMQPDPVTITWVQADSAAQIVSPGGFAGGVTADNVLTQRYARHPALADLFQALRLVEKQGLGVDRMYREMVVRGHRPPTILEEGGPRVRVRLVGGEPVVPVIVLAGRIEPAVRRRDVRVTLIVDTLLREPFVTASRLASVLQRTEVEAAEALEVAAECRVDSVPLIERFKDVWVLSRAAIALLEQGKSSARRVAGLLPYRRPETALDIARAWLSTHDRVSSGDHAALTGLTQAGALRQLERLVAEDHLVRGEGRGRNAHFLPGRRPFVDATVSAARDADGSGANSLR